MVTILYHARAVGHICKRIANESNGKIVAICDRAPLPPKVDGTLIRWDSQAILDADVTINSHKDVASSRNKKTSRLLLGDLAPTTWVTLADVEYPCLLRPERHYAAHHFYVCKDRAESLRAIASARARGNRWYASPIIPKKLEYRVFVFQDRAIKVIRRYHEDPKQLAWNAAEGGKSVRLRQESWPIESVKAAILAARALNLQFAAIDVIVGPANVPLVLEANTAPGLQREATIKNFAKLFVWASTHKTPPQTPLENPTWQTLIHPSLR